MIVGLDISCMSAGPQVRKDDMRLKILGKSITHNTEDENT